MNDDGRNQISRSKSISVNRVKSGSIHSSFRSSDSSSDLNRTIGVSGGLNNLHKNQIPVDRSHSNSGTIIAVESKKNSNDL